MGKSTNIIIPEGVRKIDSLSFSSEVKEKITSLQLPNTLEIIDNWSFDHCEQLERIVIPFNVQVIGNGAFSWCPALREVIIEGNPKMADDAFYCTQWEKDEFKKAGAKIKGNVLLSIHPDLTEYTIPPNIKVIGRDAFKNSKVKEVIVPHGVTKIDICAFAYSAVERIVLPDTLKIIGAYAFSNCLGLTELIVPKSVTIIGDNAFEELANCIITILNDNDDEQSFDFSIYSFGRKNLHVKEVHAPPYGSVAMRCAKKRGVDSVALSGNPRKYQYIDDDFCCNGKKLHEYLGSKK